MPDYKEDYPRWKTLWLTIPAIRRSSVLQDFLRRIPEERWEDVIADLQAPPCSDSTCMCFAEDGTPPETCETLPRRRQLVADGLRDEWGQHKGDPGFGSKPIPLEGHVYHKRGVNDFDLRYVKDSPIIEDLGLPTVEEGIQHWGSDYIVLPDGRHGPKRFRNSAEKLRYLKATGHREKGSYTH